MRFYAVLDTNVLVSAMLRTGSVPGRVLAEALNGDIIPVLNDGIIAEYEDVLHRSKFPINPEVADALISYIVEYGIDSSRAFFDDSMPDEDDRVFYEVTLSREDSLLVTGNLKHYPKSPRVITPADFISLF